MTTTNRKSRRTAPWIVVALLLGCLALVGCASDRIGGPEPAVTQVQLPKPTAPEKHYEAARTAVLTGNLDKAEREVKLALRDNPLDAEAHFLLGCLLAARGEHDQAIVGFQRALAIDPANVEALYNLGTLLLRRGESLPATRLFEKAVLTRPDYVPSYNNLAKAYFQAGLPELALATYEEAVRRDPSNAIALENRQRLVAAAGNQIAAGAVAVPPAALSAPVTPAPQAATAEDREVNDLRELLRDLPHVTVERRAGRLTLCGWTTSQQERAMLDKILGRPSAVPVTKTPGAVANPPTLPGPKPAGAATPPEVPNKNTPGDVGQVAEVLDLTTDDTGDPQRMIEIDAILFIVRGLDSQQLGFNFLKEINLQFNYFATDHTRDGTGFQAPGEIGPVGAGFQSGWLFGASADYVVNIANVTDEQVAVLARPHLTTLSGTPANFLAGGELVYRVSGNISGDIKPYPFGTTLAVTPTLLRTPAKDGTPRVRVVIDTGRLSVLSALDTNPDQPTAYEKVTVTSEAVLSLGQTLILSGLSQRESRSGRSGVPGLMHIPLLKYLFSTKTTLVSESAVIILLTPRDPAFQDEHNEKALAEFVEKRRAFVQARQGAPEDMRRFRERHPDWMQIAPNRFASHIFLMENSEIYRALSGEDLISDNLDLELLGPAPKKKEAPKK